MTINEKHHSLRSPSKHMKAWLLVIILSTKLQVV